ncbi:helix-turn-helix domain-containing protein [Verticiella sediminum]|uniref:Helix-turn-helix domain-containing protein n=1 Tax=Verticiella sediminum TaxID=1247510 RepID=A0A556ABB2_9BURK|nr:helix-turn-helix transcriptional regulator [Verticiella sediminum]TSH90186.1 helix-turn-helix domain-containing protein [Verticiella sediminum]
MSLEPSIPDDTLGAFVRALRERAVPAEFGIAAGRRRRVQGLRREEAAALCGISPTWYTWIEQGRAGPVSARTLAEIATGLRLTPAERAYLFRLGGRLDTAPHPDDAGPPASLSGLVHAVNCPAYVLDSIWDVRAANAPAVALFGDWIAMQAGRGPNLLRYVFLDRDAPQRIADWETRARRIVAEFRADSAGQARDPEHHAVVEELAAASATFAEAWRAHEVLAREGGRRAFRHPRQGLVDYWQFTLRVAQQPALKLVVLQPTGVDPAAHETLRDRG